MQEDRVQSHRFPANQTSSYAHMQNAFAVHTFLLLEYASSLRAHATRFFVVIICIFEQTDKIPRVTSILGRIPYLEFLTLQKLQAS